MAKGNSTAPDDRDAKQKPEKQKTPAQEMWELGLCLGVAVLLAVVIKYVLIEVFVIPSGSMEPTLHGRPDGGDRVLCTKVNYRLRGLRGEHPGPNRLEIFVFQYPYEQAIDLDRGHDSLHARYQGQNFLKRCVGLPGEILAIARGDVFTQEPDDTWVRQSKSDAIQRDLWIPVYEEDFQDLKTPAELHEFWEPSGDQSAARTTIEPGGYVRIEAPTAVHLSYRARLPRSPETDPTDLPGIPDRYVVRQPVTFTCPTCAAASRAALVAAEDSPAAERPPCQFRKTVWNQKIAGRCPRCHRYLLEDCVTFYGRRSDLPTTGDHRSASNVPQGESDKDRGIDYHWVSDLRLCLRLRLPAGPGPVVAVELSYLDPQESGLRMTQAVLDTGRKTVELKSAATVEASASLALMPAEWHALEFYYVDGIARLFIDGAPVFDKLLATNKPSARAWILKSGILLSVSGGTVDLDDIRIDRDIYYYTGCEGPHMTREYSLLTGQGVFPKSTYGEGYIALGDNCPSSNDSRSWGPVPPDNLAGPAILVWWPPHRAHWIATPAK